MLKSILFKTITVLFLISTIFILSSCSSEPKPDSFGWYVVINNSELIKLQPQKVEGWKYDGIPKLSNIEIPETKIYFLIFENDVSRISQRLKLSSLIVKTDRNPNRISYRKDLFVPSESIFIEVFPIKNENNMYKIVPSETLSNGSYALYNSDQNKFGPGSLVYDFTINTGTNSKN